MSPTNKKEIEPMKKLICLLLSVLLLVGASAAMADSVELKIATWTSNETQAPALLGARLRSQKLRAEKGHRHRLHV